MQKKKKKNILFFVLNMVVPILTGAAIYYYFFPEVLFVKKIDSILGNGIHIENIKMDSRYAVIGMRFLRNYFLDIIWAYSLVYALYLITGNNTAGLMRSAKIAIPFSIGTELLQLTPYVQGTFDIGDILVMFLTELGAVFIIKKYLSRRNLGYEEQG